MTHSITVANVFCNAQGAFGNPVGIVASNTMLEPDVRQRISVELGYSESVFVVNEEPTRIAIHNPQEEIDFSGHAVVGFAAYLDSVLQSGASRVDARRDSFAIWRKGDEYWLRAPLAGTPPWWHEALATPQDVDELAPESIDRNAHVQFWSWQDEALGTIRSRTFAPAWGIPEDEANGSGCLRLAAALGRKIVVRHGAGSVVQAEPDELLGWAHVGGRVVFEPS